MFPRSFRRLSLLAALLLQFFRAGIHAQTFTVSQLTVNEGLSQGLVTAFCQDRHGFMWIGTNNGLNRYDGFEVRGFGSLSDTGSVLDNAAISCLAMDTAGLLWVGTSEGLYVLDPESCRFEAANSLCSQLPASAISSVCCTRDGTVFATIKSDKRPLGLFRVMAPGWLREAFQKNALKSVNLQCRKIPAPLAAGTADLILGTVADSLLLLKNNSDQLFCLTPQKDLLRALEYDEARRLADPDATVLWTETAGYLFKKDEASRVACLSPSVSNTVFFRIGTQKKFFYRISKSQLCETSSIREAASLILNHEGLFASVPPPAIIQTADLNGPASRAIYSDRTGNIWIGTLGYGARLVKLNRIPFERVFPNYSAYNFRLIDSTHVWMGKIHPNDLFQPTTKKIDPAPWKGKIPVKFHLHNVVRDKAGNFWMTGQLDTVSKVAVFDPTTRLTQVLPEQLKNFSYVAEQLFIDRNGNLWVGAHNGVCLRYRPGARKAERFSYRHLLPSDTRNLYCNAILQTAEGHLFIGTNRGLIRIASPNETPEFLLYPNNPFDPTTLENNTVMALYTDEAYPNTLWIGTKGGGLNSLDLRSGQFSRFSEVDGLLNNVIYGILSDASHKLWLSSNRGISLYDPATRTCHNFQKSDGLAAGEFNTGAALQIPGGQLLFGSVDGLILLNPRAFNFSLYPIPVAVTNIRILGSPANKRPAEAKAAGSWQNLRLSSSQNNLIFEFAGLDFGNPATNRYRYRLLGLNDRWINNGTLRTANYSGLSPGKYTFEVQAATAFGEWPDDAAQINFVILAPWYRSWPAYLIYGLLLVLANIFYLRFREKQLRLQKTAELAQQESLRLQELDAFKNRILANITHEFRTPLTIILGLAERLRLGKNADTGSISTNILQQGESMLDLLNQMSDLSSLSENKIQLNYRQGNISNYIHYFAESLRSLATEKDINLSVHSEAPDLVMDFDPGRLRQVIVNLVSNAIRHTPQNGMVTVVFSADDGRSAVIRISDTGEGIKQADLPHIFERFYQAPGQQHSGNSGLGLALTNDLVTLMGGKITAESERGLGSAFMVQIPVTHDAELERNTAMHGIFGGEATALRGTGMDEQADKPVVVVIEDNRIISNYLLSCLTPAFQVIAVENGNTGISTATDVIPDLVITDLSVPGKNGFEVVQMLKSQEITSHIPIMILSASARVEERIRGRRLGADAYLGKPFHEEELLLVIKNLLELRLLWQQRYAKTSDKPSTGAPFPADMQDAVKMEDAFMAKIYAIFEEHYANESFSLDDLCQVLGYSKSKLQRKLAILTDQPAMHMLRNFRLQKAYELLKNRPEMNVSAVCFQVGFSSTSHFSRLFSKKFNVAPSEVRTRND